MCCNCLSPFRLAKSALCCSIVSRISPLRWLGYQIRVDVMNSQTQKRVESRDRAALHNLLVQHHANTEFRAQPFSPWKFNQNFDHVVSRPPRNVGMVVELGDAVIGVAWASADSYMLSDGPLFCTVQLIAVELEAIGPLRRAKAFLALVAGIRQWAASMNASHSFIHVTTGSNLAATDRLMKAAGARTVGGAYVV
jgi:hypothetical protein